MPINMPNSTSSSRAGEVPHGTQEQVYEQEEPSVIGEPRVRELNNEEARKLLNRYAAQTATTINLLREQTAVVPEREPIDISSLLPEDLIESPLSRVRNIPNRQNPRAEEKLCVEIQKKIVLLQANIDSIDALFRVSQTQEEKTIAEERQRELINGLASLYRDIEVELRETDDYDFYKISKESLKLKRDAISYKMEEFEKGQYDKDKMSRLNQEAIRVNRLLLKVQIKLAGMLLNNRTSVRGGAARNAASTTLRGAFNTTQGLKEELHFRVHRLEGVKKMRQITTTNWDGEVVWTTNIENLNITIEPTSDLENQEQKVKIKQRRWINVHTTLNNIRRDISRGHISNANKKIDLLLALYKFKRIAISENNTVIVEGLNGLKQALTDSQDGQVSPQNMVNAFALRTRDLISRINNPKHWVWVDVEYKDIAAAVRSQLYTIAGNQKDFALVLQNKAILEYYAERLSVASKRGFLSIRNKGMIERGTEKLSVWTKRGFVYPKQFAVIDLGPALELMNAGFKLEKERDDILQAKILYGRASSYYLKAAQEADKRLNEIKGVVDGVKSRGHELYAQFRDTDIKKRIGITLREVNSCNYDQALQQINAIKGRYFFHELIEPGYKRAAGLLNEAESRLRRAMRFQNPQSLVNEIIKRLKLASSDIEHKQSFRIYLVRAEDGQSTFRYVTPGTSLKGLLSSLQRDPDKTFVSMGHGWLPVNGRDQIIFNDQTPTIIISNTKPTKSIPTTRFL